MFIFCTTNEYKTLYIDNLYFFDVFFCYVSVGENSMSENYFSVKKKLETEERKFYFVYLRSA